jgi:cytochrome bd-type quinol oxidase subunit 2
MIPAARSLSPDARTALDENAARRFRPAAFAAMAGLVLSGIFNYLLKPGHSVRYSALFGVKMLLALHVFSVAILVAAPRNPRRARQLLGAAISGLAIILIAAYLKGIA